ncbi:4-alpha-glucanotransferase [Lichenicoccus sp.]|uniref:4-alpha-glucanotransferase n=1 Tax=Lichenicoccus sp. TaxID=2781899 RepID=UPI003D130775
MSDDSGALLRRLCDLAGLATQWCDIFGTQRQIAPEDLGTILAALDLAAESPDGLRDRIAQLEAEDRAPPPLVTAELSAPVFVPVPPGAWRIVFENGGGSEGVAEAHDHGCLLQAPDRPGYHRLSIGGHEIILAVAPRRCFTVADALGRENAASWGLAVQLYALRRPGDGGVGDYQALAEFAREAASHGAQALAISPVHAQFSADPDRFSPYAPSSRVMLNALHIPLAQPGPDAARLEALDLVAWPEMAHHRLAALRQEFNGATDPGFAAWRATAGTALESHALFEALHAAIWNADASRWHWRDWPAEFASPNAPGIASFRQTHAQEINFHAWLQYRADCALNAAQSAARAAGMAIGLVSDLAVGADSGGAHCWSHQGESLLGLTIGAPPDLLQAHGQNWGITAFSARGLKRHGYRGFIEMLSCAMRHAGGVRIDHAMGIARLWVVPEGQTAEHGSYLAFPEDDLRRLIRLESVRNRAIVLAEDLGTVPDGFQSRLQQDGIDGMRVMQFERRDEVFTAPATWTRQAAAMTSTHDLPPVAGWWCGHDIDERARIHATPQHSQDEEQAVRARERDALWQAMRESGAGEGDAPPSWDSERIADAAVAHSARAGCELVMLPVEDALALRDQPNLPGTTSEHPNWRRRLSRPVGSVLSEPRTAARLAVMQEIRTSL